MDIISIRRILHKNPELSACEYETCDFIAGKLKELGLDPRRIAKNGIVSLIEGKDRSKSIILRADMDALPVCEENSCDYISKNHGVMHACGHDAHMAMLLGAAHKILSSAQKPNHSIKLVFQPEEEGDGGALNMINEGVLSDPEVCAAAALHVWPSADVGTVLVKKGAFMASPNDFEIIIRGRGGHGAAPDKNDDVILCACSVVQNLQSIVSRMTNPAEPLVVSIGSINGGNTHNVMPSSCCIKGTFRTLSKDMQVKTAGFIKQITDGVCSSYGTDAQVNINFSFPPAFNDEILADDFLFYSKASSLADIVYMKDPQMTGEDFAYFSERVPGFMLLLGCGNKDKGIVSPLHSPTFNIDESCLDIGASLLANFALNYVCR